MYESAQISLEDVFRSLMLNMSLQRTKKWEYLSMQFCGMCISKITALPLKRDRLGEKNPEALNFVRWQVRYPVFKMWGHIFQTLVWFHGNVDQLKSFWWKGGRKVYNNMVASTDSPLISCSCLKDKVLLVAVRVAGERPNPTRDPNLTSQPCYGVRERRTNPEKICYDLMEHQWKYEGQLENSCYIRLSQADGWTARGLAWNRADGAEEKTFLPVRSTWCRHFKMLFWGYLTWNIERFWQKNNTFVLTGTKSI